MRKAVSIKAMGEPKGCLFRKNRTSWNYLERQTADTCSPEGKPELEMDAAGKLLLAKISRNGGKDRQMEESAQLAMTVSC